jgi:hypothetical protein
MAFDFVHVRVVEGLYDYFVVQLLEARELFQGVAFAENIVVHCETLDGICHWIADSIAGLWTSIEHNSRAFHEPFHCPAK